MTWSSTLMIRGISMMSPLLRGWARGRSAVADEAACPRAAAAVAGQFALHPDLVPAPAAGGEPAGPRGQVVDPLHPIHPDGGGVEGDQVSEISGRYPAPAGDPEHRRGVP